MSDDAGIRLLVCVLRQLADLRRRPRPWLVDHLVRAPSSATGPGAPLFEPNKGARVDEKGKFHAPGRRGPGSGRPPLALAIDKAGAPFEADLYRRETLPSKNEAVSWLIVDVYVDALLEVMTDGTPRRSRVLTLMRRLPRAPDPTRIREHIRWLEK